MEDEEAQFDGLLMTVLQRGGGISNYFDSVFGFLFRKTDFFGNAGKIKNIKIIS
ncbi:MAG: hypothetical protein MJ252_30025 [archaeon]|nr:hypothetical protein [archaeon]